MSNPLGTFDKDLVAVAWFDVTQQPGGWFSSGCVTTESGAPAGVTASVTLVESGDSLAASGSVNLAATTTLIESSDTASGQGAVAVSASAALTQGADTVASTAAVAISSSVALNEASDTLTASSAVSVAGSTTLNEGADTISAIGTVISGVTATVALLEAEDTLIASATVVSGVVGVDTNITLIESDDTLVSAATVTSIPVGVEYPFFSKGFWSAGFWSEGFWGGVGVIAAKSGASRLYYYQLQEEGLKKYEQEQGKTETSGEGQGEKKGPRRSTKVVSQPRKTDQRSEPDVIQDDEPIPSLPKPIYQGYNRVQFPDVSPLLFGIFTEFAQWELSLKPLQQKLVEKEAANEEDYRVRLLLLLAA